jgi:hypothetical protein
MQGIWLSHHTRVRYLYTLEVMLRLVLTMPKEKLDLPETTCTSSNPIYISSGLQMPMTVSPCPSYEEFFLLTGKNLLDVHGDDARLFDDNRFRAIVRMGENNTDVQLVSYLTMIGLHRILAVAAFDLRVRDKTTDGQDLRLMLAGHVKILPSLVGLIEGM